jgi:hypothetical protein
LSASGISMREKEGKRDRQREREGVSRIDQIGKSGLRESERFRRDFFLDFLQRATIPLQTHKYIFDFCKFIKILKV